MWELPFKYNKETKSYTYTKPKYKFIIPDKESEFLDIYLQDYGYDSKKHEIYDKDKFVTSIPVRDTPWKDYILELSNIFYHITAKIKDPKYHSTTRVFTDFYQSFQYKTYIVMDRSQFNILLIDAGLESKFYRYWSVMTDWMHQLMVELCHNSELRDFMGITDKYAYHKCNGDLCIEDMIYDEENEQIWYAIGSSVNDDDWINIYRYFKANECENTKPYMYDEIFSLDISVSPGNILQTLSGDASVIAFAGIGRDCLAIHQCEYFLKKCMNKMVNDNIYYCPTPFATIQVVDWNSIITKYLWFVEQKFNKKIDKVYYMPIKTGDKNIRSIAFKYKQK